MAESDRPQMAI